MDPAENGPLQYLSRLSSHALNYVASGVFAAGGSVLLVPLLTRILTSAELGLVMIFSSLAGFLSVLFLLNQHAALTRLYYDYRDSPRMLRIYLGTVFIFLVAWGVVLLAGIVLQAPLLERVIGIPFRPYILASAAMAWLRGFFVLYASLLRVQEASRRYALLQLAYFSLDVLLVVLLVAVMRRGPQGRVEAAVLSQIFLTALAAMALIRQTHLTVHPSLLRGSIAFGIPLLLHTVSRQALSLNDRVVLNFFHGLADAGMYSVALAVGGGFSILLVAINDAWAPFVFDLTTRHGTQAKPTLVQLASYYVLVITSVALLLAAFPRELLLVLGGPSYLQLAPLVPLIVTAWLLRGFYYLVVNQIFVSRRPAWVGLASVWAAVVNIGLSWVLIPRWGMGGAAVAGLLASVALFGVTYVLSQRSYPLHYEHRIGWPVMLFGVILPIMYLVSRDGSPPDVSLAIRAGLVVIYCVVIAGRFFKPMEMVRFKTWLGERRARVVG